MFGEGKGQAENTSASLLRKAVERNVRQKVHLLEGLCEGGLGDLLTVEVNPNGSQHREG